MHHQFSASTDQLIQQMMATGRYASEDELLINALNALDDQEEELRALQDGIDSVDRGDEGVSVEEAFQRLRDKHQVPGSP